MIGYLCVALALLPASTTFSMKTQRGAAYPQTMHGMVPYRAWLTACTRMFTFEFSINDSACEAHRDVMQHYNVCVPHRGITHHSAKQREQRVCLADVNTLVIATFIQKVF